MGLPDDFAPRRLGRYVLCDEIARGGMASVHLGRLLGPAGFTRTVAIKRLHEHLAKDPEFGRSFLDEARLAARIRHPNVVSTVDVVAENDELFLVMDYVQGDSLHRLLSVARETGTPVPIPIVLAIIIDVLYGLHAAHEAKSESGEPLGIVHRDLSPHNVLVGTDGIARVVDFGVAKAKVRLQRTLDGQVKGKVAYMSPEQLTNAPIDRRTDLFAVSIVMWEALTGARLFATDNAAAAVARILAGPPPAPSVMDPRIPKELDWVVMRGLAREPNDRPATARAMATMLEQTGQRASSGQIGDWVEASLGPVLAERAARVARIEGSDALARLASTPDVPAPTRSRDISQPALPDRTDKSVVTDASAAPARTGNRGAALAILGVLALFGVIGVGLFIAVNRAKAPTAPALAAPPIASVVAAPPAVVAPPVASPAPPEPTAPPIVSTTVTPPAATAAVVPGPLKGRPKTNCNPPWVLTDSGSKRYKPECL